MKKYILKPGIHQFAPNSAAVHSNDSLTDEEAEWYLQRYPHIAGLFTPQPPEGRVFEIQEEKIKMKRKRVKRVDASTPPSGGKGGV
ncbi:hypothetical protein [Mucilaginibacter phyllosphaerae]